MSMAQFNADLELQHIYLEVYAERYHHIKAFLEAYYCFTHGAVTKQGKPDWEGIFTTGIRTLASQHIVDRKLLVRELKVPLSVLIGEMKAMVRDDELEVERLRRMLDQKLNYVVLTREEQKTLISLGLKEAMPASYYQPKHPAYQQDNARYDVAGITLLV